VKPLSDEKREEVEVVIKSIEDQLEMVRSSLTQVEGKAAEAAAVEAHERATQLRLLVQGVAAGGGE
jgi:hypothetical protein